MKRHNWSEREEEILKEKITSGLTPSKIVREPEFADIGIGSIRSKYQRFKRARKFGDTSNVEKASPANKGRSPLKVMFSMLYLTI
jgi:hypothetical protein